MKFSKRQLRKVKLSLKQKNKELQEENTFIDNSKLINQIKKNYVADIDDNLAINQIEKRKIKEAKRERNIKVTWNFNIGDAVEYKLNRNSDPEIGIVLKISNEKLYENIKYAISDGTVLLMTPTGKVWVSPKNIIKLDDED